MSATFADSSALVKLYADEADAERVRSLKNVVVSELARVEVPAALWRKHRMGDVSARLIGVLVGEFEADYLGTDAERPRFHIVRVGPEILEQAARLVAVHDLRAYDAVQLASAMATNAQVPESVTFGAFDRQLCDAAAIEGLPLLAD